MWGICTSHLPMAQMAPPRGGLGLSSTPWALALCQRLFQHPAGLGKLMAALRHVEEAGPCLRGGKWDSVSLSPIPEGQEDQGCRLGMELPAVLLQMEQSRRAQKQVGTGWDEQGWGEGVSREVQGVMG